MSVLHDYECPYCRNITEVMVEASERFIVCPACRVGKAERVYLRMSSMPGKNKGRFPRFDIQLGCTVDSTQHMEQIAKSRGLVPMGVEEWNRSRNAPRTPDPMDSDEPDPRLIEIAKKAWDDVKYGRIAPEVEEARVNETIKQADFLDATKAPKVESVE